MKPRGRHRSLLMTVEIHNPAIWQSSRIWMGSRVRNLSQEVVSLKLPMQRIPCGRGGKRHDEHAMPVNARI